ncbi:SGNH/GDSL hydrolase family protein [Novosphingobium sp. SG720]|uniref:SGNH/GDSL hydrolase family protein n=1 Tax=Novosphingobium sp. SG720 TaxID=2586998 RepID=UPI001447F911|nr:SGNH/GDSL hydrolase family protein [Novosphingobium sp. SG720]NKJ44122.1 lysophospholipase L1-like esterase [Novosphingobium sp. SG720]
MIPRPIAALALLGAPLLLAASPPPQADWAAGWFSAPFAPIAGQPGGTPAIFANQTVRQVLRVDAAGSAIRLKLTNELGISPIRIAGIHIALVGADGHIAAGSDHAVTFAGAAEAWIPTGAPLVSDTVDLPIAALQHIAISVYYKDSAMPAAHHADLIVAPGEQMAADAMAGARPLRGPAVVSQVEVARAAHGPVIVAFGDSITEGAASTPGKDMSWPQQFAARLAADPRYRGWSVVNAGMSGNRLLHEGFGLPALARLDRDALAVSGVTHIVLLEGINDIGWWNKPDSDATAERVIAAYRQIVMRAHARGIKVIGGTILPYKGAVYFTPEGEAMRQAVNAFIRTGGLFDGVIDFEKAAADPTDPARIDPRLEPGDHLHPNDAGYAALAGTISPSLFEPARH